MARDLTLADGQLGSAAAALISGGAVPGSFVTAVLANTSAAEQTVVLTFQRAGGTARRVARAVLAANEQLVVSNLPLQPDDTLLGAATGAAAVDYLIVAADRGAFQIATRTAEGSPKQSTDIDLTVTENFGLTRDGVVLSGLLEDIRDVLLKIA